MWPFVDCEMSIHFAGAALRAGVENEGTLRVTVPREIGSVRGISVRYQCVAEATFGRGNSRSTHEEVLLERTFTFAAPEGGVLTRGEHRYDFALPLPTTLPPTFEEPSIEVRHELVGIVAVGGALDASTTFQAKLIPAPRVGTRNPKVVRSTPRFHDEVVLELALDSNVIEAGTPITGQLALRAGDAARLRAIEVSLVSVVQVRFGAHATHRFDREKVGVAGSELENGRAARFEIPTRALLPSFDTPTLRHLCQVVAKIPAPLSLANPELDLLVELLPAGSNIEGADFEPVIGWDRVRAMAGELADQTGFALGDDDVLVVGRIGNVDVTLRDAPLEGSLGLEIVLSYPDLGLGIRLEPRGLFSFSASPLLPESLAERLHLTIARAADRAPLDVEKLAPLFTAALGWLGTARGVEMTDRELRAHFLIPHDAERRYLELALEAKSVADVLQKAVAALPFAERFAGAEATWRRAAAGAGAMLVPIGPDLGGLVIERRLSDGSMARFDVAVETHVKDDAVTMVVRVAAGEGKTATAKRDGFADDPLELVALAEPLVDEALAARGERVVIAPYR